MTEVARDDPSPGTSRGAALLHAVQRLPAVPTFVIAVVAVLVIGLADLATDPHLTFSIFYVLLVAVTTTAAGMRLGSALAVLAAGVWFAAEVLGGVGSVGVQALNALLRLLLLGLVVAMAGTALHELRMVAHLSRTDERTGLANSRAFREGARLEIARMRRQGRPLTMVYLDVDGFKGINDRHGHAAGDEVLGRLGRSLAHHLRRTDLAGRIGGDEFVVLLSESPTEEVGVAVRRLQAGVTADLAAAGWPVTLSVGAVTFTTPPADVDAMVHAADQVMYAVKREGRAAVRHEEREPA